MARGRSPGYDDQREMILERAALLFANRGYPATSMNQVAEASGLSKPALYHYYRDKYALLLGIADNHVSRLQALVEDVSGRKLSPEAQMRELIRRTLEEYAEAQDDRLAGENVAPGVVGAHPTADERAGSGRRSGDAAQHAIGEHALLALVGRGNERGNGRDDERGT